MNNGYKLNLRMARNFIIQNSYLIKCNCIPKLEFRNAKAMASKEAIAKNASENNYKLNIKMTQKKTS